MNDSNYISYSIFLRMWKERGGRGEKAGWALGHWDGEEAMRDIVPVFLLSFSSGTHLGLSSTSGGG